MKSVWLANIPVTTYRQQQMCESFESRASVLILILIAWPLKYPPLIAQITQMYYLIIILK